MGTKKESSCPQCGYRTVPAENLRCPRCNELLVKLTPCQGSCRNCSLKCS